MKSDSLYSVIITTLAFFSGMLMFMVIISPTQLMHNSRNFVASYVYDTFVKVNYNDTFASEVANYCKPFEGRALVDCVTKNVAAYYDYGEGNYTNEVKLKSPTEFAQSGGVCRDITVTYANIFQRLGWSYQYNFIPKHVYITVFEDDTWDFYCNIDGDKYDCSP